MRLVLRVLAGLSTLTWWVVPAMGVIDLTVTWDADWPVMLEAGWGLLCTVGLGAPFLLAAVAPRLAPAALVQVLVVTAALLVAAVGGQEPPMWWFFALLVVEVPVLWLLARGASGTGTARSPALVVLAALAAPPGLGYAWSMLADNRALHFDGDITMGVDHFAVQGALGLVLVALPAVAGLAPSGLGVPGRRLLGSSAALMAGYLGLVGHQWVDVQADLGDAWARGALVWAAAVLVTSWWPVGFAGPARDRGHPRQGAGARDLPVR